MASASKLIPINVFPLVIADLVQRKVSSGKLASDMIVVQIGAHDGMHGDPVMPLIRKYHWRGLLVEPQPEIFKRLTANYANEPQVACENAAVAHENGHATLYTFKKSPELPDHASMLASFNKNALLYNGHGYQGEIEELRVPTFDLDTLLTKHRINHFDLLQIDTEGYDYEIIKLLAYYPYKPEVIHFESAFLNPAAKHECGELLHKMGYRALTIGIDTIAYRQTGDDFGELFANKGYDLE